MLSHRARCSGLPIVDLFSQVKGNLDNITTPDGRSVHLEFLAMDKDHTKYCAVCGTLVQLGTTQSDGFCSAQCVERSLSEVCQAQSRLTPKQTAYQACERKITYLVRYRSDLFRAGLVTPPGLEA